MTIRALAVIFVSFLMAACATPYTYHQNPTPLKKRVTKYYLEDVSMNLTLGDGAPSDNTQFADKDKLGEQLRQGLISELSEQRIYAASKAEADAVLSVYLNYKRTFNIGGRALNKPQFGFRFTASDKQNQPLASYDVSGFNFVPDYGFPRQTAIDLEIAAFLWGAEDEINDINRIAFSIVNEVRKVGK